MPEDDEYRADPAMARVLAFSDGVFAIAITILILNLDIARGLTESELTLRMRELLPHFGSAALSFLVTGRFWIAHREVFSNIKIGGTGLAWLNLLFLAPIVLIPFVSQLLGAYSEFPIGVMTYAGAIAFAASAELLLWIYVDRTQPLPADEPTRVRIRRGYVGIGTIAVAFLVSIPFALINTSVAMLIWILAAIPNKFVATRLPWA